MRNLVALIVMLGVAFSVVATAQDSDPLAVLKSDAALEQKEEACRQLSVNGTVDAVPVLAALLTDEKLSHMARYALEPMPFAEAGAALREALGKTSGRLKVGVVKSLGVRKDSEAVPQLVGLLGDVDGDVAQASARALGVIANADAEAALLNTLYEKVDKKTHAAYVDALFDCAEMHLLAKESAKAATIYDALVQLPDASAQVLTASLRGAVLSRGGAEGAALIAERLKGNDEAGFSAAVRVSRELTGNTDVTAALAQLLPGLAADRKVAVLDVFGTKDGDAAGAAALALATDSDVDVRAAALRAVTRMGYVPALPVLSQLAISDDAAIAEVAQQSLAYFPGTERHAALNAMLGSTDAKARGVAVKLIGQGGLDEPVAVLLNTAEKDSDEGVRVAALENLRDYAGVGEMPRLLAKLMQTTSEAESQAAEGTLTALVDRQRETLSEVTIQKAVFGALPDGPSADVTAKVRELVAAGSRSVDATNGTLGDPAPNILKKLQVDYTENGTPVSRTVSEGEVLKFASAAAPAAVVDSLCGALAQGQGNAKLAVIRMLGVAGGPKAFDAVKASAAEGGAVKDTALRTLCNWPTADALPMVLELAKTSDDASLRGEALRGAMRLMDKGSNVTAQFADLMGLARTADDKKIVLSGLTQVADAGALELAFAQFGDEAVKAEAVQAAIAIAKNVGTAAADAPMSVVVPTGGARWILADGVIAGETSAATEQDTVLLSGVTAGNFYLAVEIKMERGNGRAGIRLRAVPGDAGAQGYEVGVGQGAWVNLTRLADGQAVAAGDDAVKAVKPNDWNKVEILAVGSAVWTAVNGKLGVAQLVQGHGAGSIGLVLKAGPPHAVQFRIQKVVINPKIEIDGIAATDLIGALGAQEF